MVKFVGYKHIKYVNKSGKPIEGYSLYFTEERNDVYGVSVFEAWVSVDTFSNFFDGISPNSWVELTYNRFGNVCGCVEQY